MSWPTHEAVGQKPPEMDTNSSARYIYIRRNYTSHVNEDGNTVWRYEEKKIEQDEWASYTEIINNNSTVDNNQAVVDYNIMMGKLDDPSEEE